VPAKKADLLVKEVKETTEPSAREVLLIDPYPGQGKKNADAEPGRVEDSGGSIRSEGGKGG